MSSRDPVIPFPGRSSSRAHAGDTSHQSSSLRGEQQGGVRQGGLRQGGVRQAGTAALPRKTIVLSTNSHLQKSNLEPMVCFNRMELNLILSCYGAMVSKGEWRDYAIDMGRENALFSIFRHSSEQPLYRIEKTPALAKKQGMYLIVGTNGQILKRGHELKQLLKFFDKKLELVQ